MTQDELSMNKDLLAKVREEEAMGLLDGVYEQASKQYKPSRAD